MLVFIMCFYDCDCFYLSDINLLRTSIKVIYNCALGTWLVMAFFMLLLIKSLMGGWYLLVCSYSFNQLKIKILLTYYLLTYIALWPTKLAGNKSEVHFRPSVSEHIQIVTYPIWNKFGDQQETDEYLAKFVNLLDVFKTCLKEVFKMSSG